MRVDFSLPSTINPRWYQNVFLSSAQDLIRSKPDQWHLFTSPTGTGKSIMILMLLSAEPESICITPRIEIIDGMMKDLGYNTDALTIEQLVALGQKHGIYTPIRLRNLLAAGELDWLPSVTIVDECHHDAATTYQDITMYLNGVPKVGLTATGYRGTPKETEAFIKQWGNTVNEIIDIRGAVESRFCSFPTAEVWPLINDDLVDVAQGEFRVRTTENILLNHSPFSESTPFDSIIRNLKRFYDKPSRLFDRPTMICVPGATSAGVLANLCKRHSLPCSTITQETNRRERVAAFESCQYSQSVLIQINVVSEGVNLPKLRRIIDLSPTMSPVKWVQMIGRIMRPVEEFINEPPPEYVACCRNLERFGYLMDGLFPSLTIKDAQEAFQDDEGNILYTKRGGTRVFGLEGLGKFTQTAVHLLDGTVGHCYYLTRMEGFQKKEYFVYVHPNHSQPLYGMKESTRNEHDNTMNYGRWRLIESIPDIQGCTTAKVYDLTEKQQTRWNDSAESYGLNPHRKVNSREFQILPFLMNTTKRGFRK